MRDANDARGDPTNRRASARHVHYDPGADASPSVSLVTAVAEVAGVDPLELDPLYETVDPARLDELVGADEPPDVSGTITFTFAGHEVTVHASGLLRISPAT